MTTDIPKPYRRPKLTRQQIREGLQAVPIEAVLLGANAKGVNLTHKQKAFAEELLLTGNKTGAYKKAYKPKGKQATSERNAQVVANNSKVQTYLLALKAAQEAAAYLVPARLRALAIHKLTEKALDDDVPHAQQIKALELIGKMTEVALFTERRELIQITTSDQMKDKLLQSLRLAISQDGAIDVEATSADDLLAELTGRPDDDVTAADYVEPTDAVTVSQQPDAQRPDDLPGAEAMPNSTQSDPPTPDPLFWPVANPPPLHSNPLTQSNPNLTITSVIVTNPLESDTCNALGVNPDALNDVSRGVGVVKNSENDGNTVTVTPPVNDSKQNGVGVKK
jgi:phage terminase small subunit